VSQPLGHFAQGNWGGPPFALEDGGRMLRVRLDGAEMAAKQGSMVAYKGQVDFAHRGLGVGGLIRRAVSGEGQDLMKVRGRGIAWFAESGSHISIFNLDGDCLTVNGRNLLAMEHGIHYRITAAGGGVGSLIAGGLFNTELSGTGAVAILCLGNPLVLPTDEPVCVERDAAVAWTAGVRTRVVSSFKLGNLIGRSSGELAQVEYAGPGGFVVVQCGETPAAGTR
jgi:uncharacterized protein (AIM24 family)